MNKHQKLVQAKFLNDEEAVVQRLDGIYRQSYIDITKNISVLNKSISELQAAYHSVDANDIGDLAAAALGKKAGNMTPAEAKATLASMLQSKIYQKNYQSALKKQVDGVLDKMQVEQFQTVHDYLEQCYENGFVGTLYDLHGQGIPLMFPMDQEAMVMAVQLDSKISSGLYKHLGENVTKLKSQITVQVSRGISSGMSYEQVAQQISASMMGAYKNPGGSLAYAMRIARTEGHRIQVQSAMNACQNAKDMGADVVKQWDSTLDGDTRPSHRQVDGEIRELDEPFSNGLMYPGDPAGGAGEVVNCRCALLQRARWALDDDELETLKERAAFFGLDKTDNFDDFKDKYLQAAASPVVAPKKQYLTQKKLEQLINDGNAQLDDLKQKFTTNSGGWTYDEVIKDFGSLENFADGYDLKVLKSLKDQMDDVQNNLDDWSEKLNKKLVAAETKKLKKLQIDLQDQLDNYDVKTYSNIWKNDVTTKDWAAKQGSINAKKQYFESKLLYATDPDDIKKWQGLLDDLDDFDQHGKEYFEIQKKLNKTAADLKKLQSGAKIGSKAIDDAFTQDRKDAAYWFTSKNGSVKAADGVLRDKAGEVWRSASELEKDSIYEYTRSYHKYNEPLRGIEYGTNKFLGVGNIDLDQIGVSYAGFKPGQIHNEIDAITSIIDKSSYDFDIWLQRGCRISGMDKFFGIDMSDFNLPEADLAAKLIGTTPTEYAFMSTGVAKGKGLNTSGGILMNIYAPKGTKGMYIEPISYYGNGSGRTWDGISAQNSFGSEAELLLQRGTKFRVTKVEKSGGTIYIDMEVIEQGVS